MRVAVVLMFAFFACEPSSSAQTFEPDTIYEPAPSTFALPDTRSLEAVVAARGNLAAWRDSERRRIGPMQYDTANPGRRIREIGGYFAILPGGKAMPGVVQGVWNQPSSAVGQRMVMSGLRYIRPYQVCGAPRPSESAEMSDLVYLGHSWSESLSSLDAMLAGDRTVGGEPLPTPLAFAGPPTGADFSRYYPPRAFDGQVSGTVTLNCLVNGDGTLQCGVVSEDPEGHDFAVAARRILESPRVTVQTVVEGQSIVGRCGEQRINFRMAG